MTVEKAEFKIEENPDVNLCSALAVIRHPDVYIWVDHDVDDGTKDVKLAHQIAALLRFQSAMTPEMWEGLIEQYRYKVTEGRARTQGKSGKLVANVDRDEAIFAALDTLRQEIQQP